MTIQHRVRSWGELLYADGLLRDVRNALLQDRSPTDYRHLDWLYASWALRPATTSELHPEMVPW